MDLEFLRPLYDERAEDERAEEQAPGYVSVYLDTTPAAESAGTELALRWRAAREKLAADGAGEATLDAVGDALTSRDHAGYGQAVFAADGRVRMSAALPSPPRTEISRYAPLPHVMPLLAQLPPRAAHVRVAATRNGAEIVGVPADDGTGGIRVGAGDQRWTAGDQHWPVHKVSAGGSAEKRLQRRAEESWMVNAKEAAAAVAVAADRVGAEFAVVGGDVRERVTLLGLLPPRLREDTVIVDREVPADDAAFEQAAAAEAARRAETASRALLDEFRVRMETRDLAVRRAAEGLPGILAALRDGLVQDVLVADGFWSDTATGEAAGAGEAGGSVKEKILDRPDAMLARSAALTGAGLYFVPPDADPLADGVGALLRAPLAAV